MVCLWLGLTGSAVGQDVRVLGVVGEALQAVAQRDPRGSIARLAAAWLLSRRGVSAARAAARPKTSRGEVNGWSGGVGGGVSGDAEESRAAGLLGSSHEAVRVMAGRRLGGRLGRRAFERVWDAWPRLDDVSRLRAARAALRLDPTARAKLDAALAGDVRDRSRAQSIAAQLEGGDLREKGAGGAGAEGLRRVWEVAS